MKRRKDVLSDVRRHYTTGEEFTIMVLWVMGYSVAVIAKVMRLRLKQVAGKIKRFDFVRADMTDMDRQALLRELEEVRYEDGSPLDGGLLDRFAWGILPIKGKQKKGI